MADSHCRMVGIDSIGNSIPESITMGIKSTIAEISSLILFVYTIGMQVGPGFMDSIRRHGLVLNVLSVTDMPLPRVI